MSLLIHPFLQSIKIFIRAVLPIVFCIDIFNKFLPHPGNFVRVLLELKSRVECLALPGPLQDCGGQTPQGPAGLGACPGGEGLEGRPSLQPLGSARSELAGPVPQKAASELREQRETRASRGPADCTAGFSLLLVLFYSLWVP